MEVGRRNVPAFSCRQRRKASSPLNNYHQQAREVSQSSSPLKVQQHVHQSSIKVLRKCVWCGGGEQVLFMAGAGRKAWGGVWEVFLRRKERGGMDGGGV